MLPDRVSNPGPMTYESGALPIALHGPANTLERIYILHRPNSKEYFNRAKILTMKQMGGTVGMLSRQRSRNGNG